MVEAQQGLDEAPQGRYIILPETPEVEIKFGPLAVLPGINAEGCVDPRKVAADPIERALLVEKFSIPLDVLAPHYHPGAWRHPGGSAGIAMALMGALPDISTRDAYLIVQLWERSENRNFLTHRDNHVHTPNCGCGHVDRATLEQNEHLYGIPAAKVAELRTVINEEAQAGKPHLEIPVLTEEHDEKAALLVLTDVFDPYTVESTDGIHQLFRFDASRFEHQLEAFAFFAQARAGVPINNLELQRAATQQRNATFGLLAGGLPLYEVDLRGGRDRARFLQTIAHAA